MIRHGGDMGCTGQRERKYFRTLIELSEEKGDEILEVQVFFLLNVE